jgi:hypothetical protein
VKGQAENVLEHFMLGGAKIQRCGCHIPRISIRELSPSIPEGFVRKGKTMKNKRKKEEGDLNEILIG